MYFKALANVESFTVEEEEKRVLVTFVDRENALTATQKGAYFEGRTLHLSWYVDPSKVAAPEAAAENQEATNEEDHDDMGARYKRE